MSENFKMTVQVQKRHIKRCAFDVNTSRSKVIWITGIENAKGKTTNTCYLMFRWSFALSVHTNLCWRQDMCLHIQGQVLLVSSSNTSHFLKQNLFQNIQWVEICHMDSKRLNIQEAPFRSLCFPIKCLF